MRVLILLLLPVLAFGQSLEKEKDWVQSAFGSRAMFEYSPEFSYLSVWGTSALRDIETTANGGAISLNNGFIRLDSGSSADASADLETVERVAYIPGREAELSIRIEVINAPVNGAVAEWGIGNSRNGAFFRLGDGIFSVVYRSRGTDTEIVRADFSADAADCQDFDPVDDEAIYRMRYSWYGSGGVQFIVNYPKASQPDTIQTCILHYHVPDNPWDNPNLPIFARVDNTDASDDDQVIIEVGGRSADILGMLRYSSRQSGDFRAGQSVATADGLVPLICLRRESDFPDATIANTVDMQIVGFDIITDQDTAVFILLDPDITGGTFGTPTHHLDGETALESNTGATSVSSTKQVSGPYLFEGGGGPDPATGGTFALQLDFVGNEPICLAADALTTDATITSSVRILERW